MTRPQTVPQLSPSQNPVCNPMHWLLPRTGPVKGVGHCDRQERSIRADRHRRCRERCRPIHQIIAPNPEAVSGLSKACILFQPVPPRSTPAENPQVLPYTSGRQDAARSYCDASAQFSSTANQSTHQAIGCPSPISGMLITYSQKLSHFHLQCKPQPVQQFMQAP